MFSNIPFLTAYFYGICMQLQPNYKSSHSNGCSCRPQLFRYKEDRFTDNDVHPQSDNFCSTIKSKYLTHLKHHVK